MAPCHWAPPGAYACICAVEQGWRPLRWPPTLAQTVQVTTAHESDEPIVGTMKNTLRLRTTTVLPVFLRCGFWFCVVCVVYE